MQNLNNIALFISLCVIFYLFFSWILRRIKLLKYDYKRQREKAKEAFIAKNMKQKPLYRIKNTIRSIILKSGITNYVSITERSYMYISLAIFIVSFIYFKKIGTVVALVYSMAITYVPFAILMFMGEINTRKIKKMYLNFLNTFDGFHNVEGNIINSLKATAEYMEEPLKSILRKNVERYERTIQSTNECLDNIMQQIGYGEFRKFLKFAKLHAKYGGDFGKAISKLREQGEKMAALESVKAAGAAVGSMVILLMVFLNMIMIFNLLKTPDMVYILKTSITGQVIAISNAVAIGFSLFMIKHINEA